MARDIPYAIFTLLSYEFLRDKWVRNVEVRREGKSSAWRNMIAGGTAGGIGSFLTNPMDVIKTRLQTYPGAYTGGIAECATRTWSNEGPLAFFKGSFPRLMHKVPANAVFFVSYEIFRRLLQVQEYAAEEEARDSQIATSEKSQL